MSRQKINERGEKTASPGIILSKRKGGIKAYKALQQQHQQQQQQQKHYPVRPYKVLKGLTRLYKDLGGVGQGAPLLRHHKD